MVSSTSKFKHAINAQLIKESVTHLLQIKDAEQAQDIIESYQDAWRTINSLDEDATIANEVQSFSEHCKQVVGVGTERELQMLCGMLIANYGISHAQYELQQTEHAVCATCKDALLQILSKHECTQLDAERLLICIGKLQHDANDIATMKLLVDKCLAGMHSNVVMTAEPQVVAESCLELVHSIVHGCDNRLQELAPTIAQIDAQLQEVEPETEGEGQAPIMVARKALADIAETAKLQKTSSAKIASEYIHDLKCKFEDWKQAIKFANAHGTSAVQQAYEHKAQMTADTAARIIDILQSTLLPKIAQAFQAAPVCNATLNALGKQTLYVKLVTNFLNADQHAYCAVAAVLKSLKFDVNVIEGAAGPVKLAINIDMQHLWQTQPSVDAAVYVQVLWDAVAKAYGTHNAPMVQWALQTALRDYVETQVGQNNWFLHGTMIAKVMADLKVYAQWLWQMLSVEVKQALLATNGCLEVQKPIIEVKELSWNQLSAQSQDKLLEAMSIDTAQLM